jgi:UDP-glucose 6-dehydrogenase
MNSIILGKGQVGSALAEVLKQYNPTSCDETDAYVTTGRFDIMHVCFPYSKDFVKQVKDYQKKFKPKYTVIHSTVPVGTSRKCKAIHSPIVGIHPFLAQSIKTFTKFLAGKEASYVADYFRRAGCKVYLFDKQETTEIAKLSQTTFYAMTIEYVKDLKRQCDKLGLSFSEVFTIPATDYNRGYEELGLGEIKIPLLNPIMKKQGGHCTIPNCGLWTTEFTTFIEKMNMKEVK